jgi:uncharacterized protein
LGDISLLTIETDGSYQDLDVLKITQENQASLNLNLKDHSIHQAATSAKIQEHRRLLRIDGLSKECQVCPVVQVCGGGAVPHRFDGKGFNNPTVYCQEMLSLIQHVTKRLKDVMDDQDNLKTSVRNTQSLDETLDPIVYNQAQSNNKSFDVVYNYWIKRSFDKFKKALDIVLANVPNLKKTVQFFYNMDEKELKKLSALPSIQLWSDVIIKEKEGLILQDLDEKTINADYAYLSFVKDTYLNRNDDELIIHPDDEWLRKPFGSKIIFEGQKSTDEGTSLTKEALKIIESYNPYLYEEIKKISPVIVFIQDPTAHPDKLVSFSDNVVPGALYICIRHSGGAADPYDLADSIIHEHRHQKLYLLESYNAVVVSDLPYVASPWREEPRPVSGLFHAVFVFNELMKYWKHQSNSANSNLNRKAKAEYLRDLDMLKQGISTLEKCKLTLTGTRLLNSFKEDIEFYQAS